MCPDDIATTFLAIHCRTRVSPAALYDCSLTLWQRDRQQRLPDPDQPRQLGHGLIYFDLPANDKAVSAELHDSVFSGGVTVSLTH